MTVFKGKKCLITNPVNYTGNILITIILNVKMNNRTKTFLQNVSELFICRYNHQFLIKTEQTFK